MNSLKKIISLLITVLCVIISITCFTSCSDRDSAYYSDIKLLKKGPYCLDFNIIADYGTEYGVLAKNGDKYYFFIDDTVLLLSSDESYVIDHTSKTYCEYNSVDLSYNFFDNILNLKYKKKSDIDSGYTVMCKNPIGGSVQLVYENDKLNAIEIELPRYTDYSKFEIISLTNEIPDSISFDIPQDYTYKMMGNLNPKNTDKAY